MTDQELIVNLRNLVEQYFTPPYGREVMGTTDLLTAAADRLEKLLAEKRWISVEERLPEDGDGCVLVCVSGMFENLVTHNRVSFHKAAEIGYYTTDGWILEGWPEWDDPGVSHWMPIPTTQEADQ